MIRMFVYVALLLALAFGVVLLVETPGSVLISAGGLEVKLTLAKAVMALIGVIVLVMVLWAVLRTLLRLPSLIALSNRMRRRSKGYAAVSRGLVSVGVGDARTAARHAQEAERFLGREPLALLLKAQAAQLSGDRKVAEQMFTRMLDTPDTRLLGLRGLYVEARREGNPAARQFVAEAYRLAPATPWAGEAQIDYLTQDRNWRDALAAVDDSARRKVIDRGTAKQQKATLLAAAALEENEKSPDNAYITATEALKLNPGLVPAAVLAGRRLIARGDISRATRLLETAWKQSQHPDIAETYLAVRHGDSTADRLKRARALARLTPTAREAKLTVARAALDAQEFVLAREALEPLVLDAPTARACRLMAELEDRESGNAGMVRKWLARASHAPRDPAWVADGYVSEHWAPVSPITGRIDAFRWMTPPQSLESSVRAAIEADRFAESAAPVVELAPPAPVVTAVEPPVVAAEPVQAAPVPEPIPAPAPVPVTVPLAVPPEAPVAPPVVAEPAAAAVAAIEAPPAEPAEASAAAVEAPSPTVLTHLPDDPGPRLPGGKVKKRWGVFG